MLIWLLLCTIANVKEVDKRVTTIKGDKHQKGIL